MTAGNPEAGPAAAKAYLRRHAGAVRRPMARVTAAQMAGAALMIGQYALLAAAIDRALFAAAPLDDLLPLLLPVPVMVLARAALAWAIEIAAVSAAGRVRALARDELAAHLTVLGPVRLGGAPAGALSALLVDGVEALDPYYSRFLPAMRAVAVLPLAVLAVVLPLDWVSGLVLVATAPLIPLFMALIGAGAERLNRQQWAGLARMGAHFLEVVQGLTTLKLFDASRAAADTVGRVAESYRVATMSVLRVAFLSGLALEFFATLGVAVVAVLVGFRLLAGEIDFERGLFVLLLVPEFYLPLRQLGVQYHARMEALAPAGRIAALLDRPALPLRSAATSVPPSIEAEPSIPPSIEFNRVGVVYAPGRIGLDDASFTLEPGVMTALVGPSGAGKSTVVNLLLGFVEPTTGEILVGGRPLAGVDAGLWRRRIAWVPQRPRLLVGTVADNIRLGAPAADRAAIVAAARAVGADQMIAALPEGYDQRVGEDGAGLSGGQVRLVALARAALRDAPLLIFDEPSASLDRDTETALARALPALARGRTTLVIAHRPATIAAAGRIIRLEQGRVVPQ